MKYIKLIHTEMKDSSIKNISLQQETATFSIALLFSVLFFVLPSFSFGVSDNEKSEVRFIQNQLTNSYLDSDEKAVGLRILEEKILESKIDALTIEDNISEYDDDIAILQEKINILFPQIAEPKQEIAKLISERNELYKGIKTEGKKLVLIYLELSNLQRKNNHSGAQGFMAMMSETNEERNDNEIAIESLQKVEVLSLDIYNAATAELKENNALAQELEASIKIKEDKYNELSDARDKLQQEKELQEEMLLQAHSEKEEYSDLLVLSRKQMMQSMIDAVRIDSSLQELNEKIAALEEARLKKTRGQAQLNADKIQNTEIKDEYTLDELDDDTIASIDLQMIRDAQNIIPSAPLAWPIYPERGISAGFRESGYYEQFKMQHNAIDIRASQSTNIASAADGYVYKAVDNGLGYSYIIILHRNNLRTVYGHVSNIYVQTGQMVEEGQIIGLSGGMPGTKGAGKMTTGPHLHFEVLQNEVYKNPLEFLDTGVL